VKILLIAFLIALYQPMAASRISIEAAIVFQKNSITEKTLTDFSDLLLKTNNTPFVENRNQASEIIIVLDSSKLTVENTDESFQWDFKKEKNTFIYTLQAASFIGFSNGLYALLQEKLGFQFFHPKELFIPQHIIWPLDTGVFLKGKPVFNRRGFHIHTQHPLELTSYLLDYKSGEKGIEEIKQYIDWLTRNQQNYFQFVLLEDVDIQKWPTYFLPIAQYAKARGIKLGLGISLHQVQQKSFMLYKNIPGSWKSKDKQIIENIDLLCQIPWDIWSIDLKKHEYAGNESDFILRKKKLIEQELSKKKIKLFEHYHIVNNQSLNKEVVIDSLLLKKTGSLIHTVMFYSLSDKKTPVYENKNFNLQRLKLESENKIRETWYFPESAYWVTFDNSIPMFLSPYLNARLSDIQLCDSFAIPGHLTFSSGWEWNYWLIDWSIARWSWNYNNQPKEPYQYITSFFDTATTKLVGDLWNLQNAFIKDKELIRYLTAQAPTDELPNFIFNKEFHPRPNKNYSYIRNKASITELDTIRKNAIKILAEYCSQSERILFQLKNRVPEELNKKRIFEELIESTEITVLRAKHKMYILEYLCNYRMQKIENKSDKKALNEFMILAQNCRADAQKIVTVAEKKYRYPVENIARKNKNLTAYKFGYLYPVSELHFWKREEAQAKKNKYNAFFMSIWNMPKIVGLIN